MSLNQQTITEYLETSFGVDSGMIEKDTLLFSTSILDSFSMVDLIMFIEKSAGIKFRPSDVNLNNLDSIERILSYLEKRQAES